MIIVSYDNKTNKITGFYPKDLAYSNIPSPNIEISDSDWKSILNMQSSNKEPYIENGKVIYKDILPEPPSDKEKCANNIFELEEWFTWYDRQIQEYMRCQRLGLEYTNDDGLMIQQLDELAETNKQKLNNMRKMLEAYNEQ